jgi:hypothetical protein
MPLSRVCDELVSRRDDFDTGALFYEHVSLAGQRTSVSGKEARSGVNILAKQTRNCQADLGAPNGSAGLECIEHGTGHLEVRHFGRFTKAIEHFA